MVAGNPSFLFKDDIYQNFKQVKIRIRGLSFLSNARLYACTARAANIVVLPEPK